MTKFNVGDVLYIPKSENSNKEDSVVVITNITSRISVAVDNYLTNSTDKFYHVAVLDGSWYDWFMGGSPIEDNCILMVSNLNEAEKLAIAL